ncbi:hypothetical protein Emag_000271 [Eimeria magna]
MGDESPTSGSLDSFNISKPTKKQLKVLGFNRLLPVQVLSFKHVYKGFVWCGAGRDVVCKARTGTGKTLAFALPLIEKCLSIFAPNSFEPRPLPKGLIKKQLGSPDLKVFWIQHLDVEKKIRYQEPELQVLGFRIVVVLPTRELAQQVHADFARLSVGRYGAACIFGGAPEGPQINMIRQGVHVLVATPGRLLDYIERGVVTLESVEAIVLDEADKLLEMGFREDIEKLLQLLQQQKAAAPDTTAAAEAAADTTAAAAAARGDYQLLLFTATFPRWARSLSENFMRREKKVFLDASLFEAKTKEKEEEAQESTSMIQHLALQCHWKGRIEALPLAISLYAARAAAADREAAAAAAAAAKDKQQEQQEQQEAAQCVIFCETKQEVNDVALNSSISSLSSPLHGDIPQQQREATLASFRKGRFNCLVATDVAARGLDISSVRLVIQMSPPRDVETYVHRAGRTGRAGRRGIALLFYEKRDADFLAQIEKEGGFSFTRVGFPQPAVVHNQRLISMATRLFPDMRLESLVSFSSKKTKETASGEEGETEEGDTEEALLQRLSHKLLKKREAQDVVIELLRKVLGDSTLGGAPKKEKGSGAPCQGLSALTGRPGFAAYKITFQPPPSPPLQRSCAYVWKALKSRCSSSASASALIEKLEYMTLTADGCGAVFEVPEDDLEAWQHEVIEAFFYKAPKSNACNGLRNRGGITLRRVTELPPLQDALFLARQQLQQQLKEDPRGSRQAARFNPNHLSNRRGGGAAAAAGGARGTSSNSSSSRGFSASLKGIAREGSNPARSRGLNQPAPRMSATFKGRGDAAVASRGPAKRRRVA